jgi:hypothetical protein
VKRGEGAVQEEPRRLLGGQQVVMHKAAQPRLPASQQARGPAAGRVALQLQPTAAQQALNKQAHAAALRAKAELKAGSAQVRSAQVRSTQVRAAASRPPPPPQLKATKVCRNCKEDTPLKDYFLEKRLPDGLMHMCAKCAQKKGLSGKPATPDVIASIMRSRGVATGMLPPPRADRPAAQHLAGPSAGGAAAAPGRANGAAAPLAVGRAVPSGQRGLPGFYGVTRAVAPAARTVLTGGHRRVREDLDAYEADFVADDDDEDDWRQELMQVRRRLPVHLHAPQAPVCQRLRLRQRSPVRQRAAAQPCSP